MVSTGPSSSYTITAHIVIVTMPLPTLSNPALVNSCLHMVAIPIATPACGNSVMPRYLRTIGSALVIVAPSLAPRYLPRQRAIRYSKMQISSFGFPKKVATLSSAPLRIKNNIRMGGVQWSVFSIIWAASLRTLTNTAPAIMHTSRSDSVNGKL